MPSPSLLLVSSLSYSLPFIRCYSPQGTDPPLTCSGCPVHVLQRISKLVSQQGLIIVADRLINCRNNTALELRDLWGHAHGYSQASMSVHAQKNKHAQKTDSPGVSYPFPGAQCMCLFTEAQEGKFCGMCSEQQCVSVCHALYMHTVSVA